MAERARGAFDIPRSVTQEERAAGIALICGQMNAHGLTSVHQTGMGTGDFRAYQDVYAAGDLTFRMYAMARGGTFQALKVCTMNGAYASFEEDEKGSVTAGKLGDFVVLAEDPHDIDPDRIKEIQVVRTVVGGRTVHGA